MFPPKDLCLRHWRQLEAQARRPLRVRRPGREAPLDHDEAAPLAAATVGATDETQLVGAGEQELYSDQIVQQWSRWEPEVITSRVFIVLQKF